MNAKKLTMKKGLEPKPYYIKKTKQASPTSLRDLEWMFTSWSQLYNHRNYKIKGI